MEGLTREHVKSQFVPILNAYNMRKGVIVTKTAQAAKEHESQEVAIALGYTTSGIPNLLNAVQQKLATDVTGLMSWLGESTPDLVLMQSAILYEQARYQLFKKIRIAAEAKEILTQEHQMLVDTFKTAVETKTSDLDANMEVLRLEWQENDEQFDFDTEAREERLQASRVQAAADLKYQRDRKRVVLRSTYIQKGRELERELNASTKDREKDWNQRRRVLDLSKVQIENYRELIATYPDAVKEVLDDSRKKAIEEAHAAETTASALREQEFVSRQNMHTLHLDNYQKTIDDNEVVIASLQENIAQAYAKLQHLSEQVIQ